MYLYTENEFQRCRNGFTSIIRKMCCRIKLTYQFVFVKCLCCGMDAKLFELRYSISCVCINTKINILRFN